MMIPLLFIFFFFFFNDTATTEIYTLSLHDALPISSFVSRTSISAHSQKSSAHFSIAAAESSGAAIAKRSEEHTSELQSHLNLVCRLLLEKKKKTKTKRIISIECTLAAE